MVEEDRLGDEALVQAEQGVLRSGYAAARARHMARREEAYDSTRQDAIVKGICGPLLRGADIDTDTMLAWQRSWGGVHPSGAGGWNWPRIVERLPHRPAVLPVAIWYGDDLCGMAVGQASRRRADGVRHTVTLTYVERRPEPPPVLLRGEIIPLAIGVARAYGVTIGARRLRLRNPDRNLLWYYRAPGFDVVWRGARRGAHPVYCEQEI